MKKQREQLDVDLIEVIAQARAEERAAVVAFMRAYPEWPACPQCRDADLYVTANAIERGAHRREEEK